jgi:hypothetical protein
MKVLVVLGGVRCVLLRVLVGVRRGWVLFFFFRVEVICCALFCKLEAVEGRLCLREVPEVLVRKLCFFWPLRMVMSCHQVVCHQVVCHLAVCSQRRVPSTCVPSRRVLNLAINLGVTPKAAVWYGGNE